MTRQPDTVKLDKRTEDAFNRVFREPPSNITIVTGLGAVITYIGQAAIERRAEIEREKAR